MEILSRFMKKYRNEVIVGVIVFLFFLFRDMFKV